MVCTTEHDLPDGVELELCDPDVCGCGNAEEEERCSDAYYAMRAGEYVTSQVLINRISRSYPNFINATKFYKKHWYNGEEKSVAMLRVDGKEISYRALMTATPCGHEILRDQEKNRLKRQQPLRTSK